MGDSDGKPGGRLLLDCLIAYPTSPCAACLPRSSNCSVAPQSVIGPTARWCQSHTAGHSLSSPSTAWSSLACRLAHPAHCLHLCVNVQPHRCLVLALQVAPAPDSPATAQVSQIISTTPLLISATLLHPLTLHRTHTWWLGLACASTAPLTDLLATMSSPAPAWQRPMWRASWRCATATGACRGPAPGRRPHRCAHVAAGWLGGQEALPCTLAEAEHCC